MIQQIELEKIPSQKFGIVLNNQNCLISLYTRGVYTYCDLYIDDKPVCLGAICLDRINIIPYEYLGFVGNLMFIDRDGNSDPDYSMYNDKYILVYSDEF